jgi:hypothetical protein
VANSWRAILADDATLQQVEIVEAWQRCHSGNGSEKDGRIIIAHLAKQSGYYDVPNFERWVQTYGTPNGFADHCMRHAAKRELFATVLSMLNANPARLMRIEHDRGELL